MLTLAGSALYHDDGSIIISMRDENGTYVYDQANPAKCGYYPHGATLDQFVPNHSLAYQKMREYIHQEMKPRNGYHQGEMNVVLAERLRDNPDVVMLGLQSPSSLRSASLAGKSVVLPTFASEGGQREGMLRQIHLLMQQNPPAKKIVIPVGLAGTVPMHFNSIVIEPGNPAKIHGFDPFSERSGYHQQLSRLIDDMKDRHPGLKNADVSYNHTKLQQDGSSCGLWTAWFIDDIATRSGASIRQYDTAIDSHVVRQRADFIQQEYHRNKEGLKSTGTPMQHRAAEPVKTPAPQLIAAKKPTATPLVTQAPPRSDNWEVMQRVQGDSQSRAEAPIVRDPRTVPRAIPETLATQPHRLNTEHAKFTHPFSVTSQETVTYKEKSTNNSGYRVEVSKTGAICPVHSDPAKFPNNKKDTNMNNYRDALLQTMKFAVENNEMKTFEVASTTFPQNDHLYMDRLKVVFEVAKLNGIKVTMSEADNKKLNEIYSNPRVDAGLRDKAKVTIEMAHEARFIEPPRSPSMRS